jgi:ABC-type Fe3+/spermidine/putrescine transport system ATPase subunit
MPGISPRSAIYNRPASPFVASFMGAANIVPLRLGRAQDMQRRALLWGTAGCAPKGFACDAIGASPIGHETWRNGRW